MTTTGREALERLARIHRIDPQYHDIWGNHHEVPDASLVALLGALGIGAGTPEEVERAIRAAESERWRSVLDPVIVVR